MPHHGEHHHALRRANLRLVEGALELVALAPLHRGESVELYSKRNVAEGVKHRALEDFLEVHDGSPPRDRLQEPHRPLGVKVEGPLHLVLENLPREHVGCLFA